MTRFRGDRDAPGGPGIVPRWTHGAKEGLGTAYSADSRVWFTLWNGVLTEVYYPTIDRPQLRDMQFLITDGSSFFHEEKRHLVSRMVRLSDYVPAYRITNSDPHGRYSITKDVIVSPHLSCVLQRVSVDGMPDFVSRLKLYILCAPHLQGGGAGNNGYVIESAGRWLLAAEKGGMWMAVAPSIPFSKLSCGYVGESDGWTDLAGNLKMDWEFDRALDGNVALTGELAWTPGMEFTLALSIGDSRHNAVNKLMQALSIPFESHLERYADQWNRTSRILPLEEAAQDGGNLYHSSHTLLLAHEDKTYPGAIIASLSIPWGEAKGDEDQGGYHLVWTRDMVGSAIGLLAAGDEDTPLRALIYLAASQNPDGGFAQNFWIDGQPYWSGVQLDEAAFPIMLAHRLQRLGALGEFDPYEVVLRGAAYLIAEGPVTQQERWEEASGYSPSTLASNIAALICAACFARERGHEAAARFLEEHADFLESHLEEWTVTSSGTVLPDVTRHYVRIGPEEVHAVHPSDEPTEGVMGLRNQEPGQRSEYPAKEIIDAGFLELVRYGIRAADDPIIVDSLEVVDALLKVETPFGPCWRRYNHDGYGQRADGGPYLGWGVGRAWPLLTGERGHYELAAGRDPAPYIHAMEGFASAAGLLPEQIWDEPDRPDLHMYLGGPTGAAMPLMWAHAEYTKLLRSATDGKVFDLIPEVAERYQDGHRPSSLLEIWKRNRQPKSIKAGRTLRVEARDPFELRVSRDGGKTSEVVASSTTEVGIHYVDIAGTKDQEMPLHFAFRWQTTRQWEGNYEVAIKR
ncbi:MAG: glucan 1,4-alpha-glucosidase [Chloroflexi bacterium]|nr:glucan 1,4-alpha-glucosidase [Chloroflexota bacterium]